MAENGGCSSVTSKFEPMPNPGSTDFYLGLRYTEWNAQRIWDYGNVRGECRAEERTGSIPDTLSPEDYAFAAEKREQVARWASPEIRDAAQRESAKLASSIDLSLLKLENGPKDFVPLADLIRTPDRYVGKHVDVRWIPHCMKYGGRYVCFPASDAMFGRIMVVANRIDNAQWQDKIDRECPNMAAAVRCRPRQVMFRLDGHDTDATGRMRIVKTDVLLLK
jgi:hypothetical protein